MNPQELAIISAQVASAKKAENIVLLDLRGQSDLCDYVMICSGNTDVQNRAIADGIEEQSRLKLKVKPVASEGRQSGNWILLDYGSVIVHIFHKEIRAYYSLESLWPSAKPLSI